MSWVGKSLVYRVSNLVMELDWSDEVRINPNYSQQNNLQQQTLAETGQRQAMNVFVTHKHLLQLQNTQKIQKDTKDTKDTTKMYNSQPHTWSVLAITWSKEYINT